MENKSLIIFVVEDNPIYQHLVTKKLDPVTDAIHFFASREVCIDKLRNSQPDIIVLNNDLEGALSGLDTVRTIRSTNQELCVIIFSGVQGLDTAENLSTYGHFEYVEKDEMAFSHLKNKICTTEVYLLKNRVLENVALGIRVQVL